VRGSAAVSARDALARGDGAPAVAPAAARIVKPVPRPRRAGADGVAAPGPYLGGDSTHRVSFSVLSDRMRNLRIDGRQMAANARIVNGRVGAEHAGFEMVAEWVDAEHVQGKVRMRGRWGRGVSFGFTARRRVGDVLSG
jgi:hypothetical protein